MANIGKVSIYAGAPESSALDWGTADLLPDFQPQIAVFTGQDSGDNGLNHGDRTRPLPSPCCAAHLEASSAPGHAAWRSMPLERRLVPTGFSQQTHDFGFELGPGPAFISTASISLGIDHHDPSDSCLHDGLHDAQGHDDASDLASQFYEHSLAIHEDISSSQLVSTPTYAASDRGDEKATVDSFRTSDLATSTSFQSNDSTLSPALSVKGPLLLRGGEPLITNLDELPSVSYLAKIQPQTMTCNLLVGIMSISRPREVQTRWGSSRTLVEILVGDETKAGFAVTFWLANNTTVAQSVLAGLRSRDVILIQNVALNAFMKKVYGSGLRKDLTKIHLLYRARLDALDSGGYYSSSDLASSRDAHLQLAKTRQVWNWVLQFVGDGRTARGAGQGRKDSKKGSAPRVDLMPKAGPRPGEDRPPLDDSQ
ncbi:hypothetical protein B0H66DRAFT_288235 [Apodospora peruviana]|uniref:Uncharacterized protein n=1 Tax=Apodospora peruviana TaxID=516989 RepID=A0AAE0I271_9PEZI|nr:hypothetical protein B0H66DRAFT_288235 [Apodospora peruviana]